MIIIKSLILRLSAYAIETFCQLLMMAGGYKRSIASRNSRYHIDP